jgi:hypothetical protein
MFMELKIHDIIALKIVTAAQKDNKPIELRSNKVTDEKIDYLPAAGRHSQ